MANITKSAEVVGKIIGLIFGSGIEYPSSRNILSIYDIRNKKY
jgi:hypothetical protein